MFTGIIETLGTITDIRKEQENIHFTVQSAISPEMKIDQSVAHDGVCLTVVALDKEQKTHTVTAIQETLNKTRLSEWEVGSAVNLERCMVMNGRLDGHIVQGHVDQIATCVDVQDTDGSWKYTFEYEEQEHVTVEKGSICVNGVSLTVVDSKPGTFSVAIIPYTREHTNFKALNKGQTVNLEFDIIGKYVARLIQKR